MPPHAEQCLTHNLAVEIFHAISLHQLLNMLLPVSLGVLCHHYTGQNVLLI